MQRFIRTAAALCGVLLFSVAASAQSRAGVFEGFGGTTFGTTATAPTFGGSVAVPFGDNMQIVGEAGRLTDIKASTLDTALDFTPADIRMAAWYGEGGVRFTGSARSAVRPYVEATAGFARLNTTVGLDGLAGAITNAGLAFLGRTEPLLGLGAGVMFQEGRLVVDAGYRYKRIMVGNGLTSALALGSNTFDVNQVRVGVGVRF